MTYNFLIPKEIVIHGVQWRLVVAGLDPTSLDVAGFLAVEKLANQGINSLWPVSIGTML